MQQDFVSVEFSALYDLLAFYTSKYTQILKEGGLDDDLKKYEGLILLLQNEIKERRIGNLEAIGNSKLMPANA